jgi:hypothetical protein
MKNFKKKRLASGLLASCFKLACSSWLASSLLQACLLAQTKETGYIKNILK